MKNLNEFRKGLEFVLKWEGGYSNDPDDPGGETKWGISKRSHPNIDIEQLLPEQAAQIYRDEYWDSCGCDDIPFPFNVVVFDTAVNCGVSRAKAWLKDCPSVKDYIEKRKQYYYACINKNPPSIKYLKGWLNRLGDLTKYIEVVQVGV